MTVKVCAEAGQCHMGSVDTAITMARAARQAGASMFKVQLLTPHKIATADAGLYWKDDLGNRNQREAFTRAGLIDYGAWGAVKEACDGIGIEFLATPFDLDAIEALEAIGVSTYKVASGDITYRLLLETLNETGKSVVLSTGASEGKDVILALDWLADCQVTLLACTLSYPTPNHAAHLARIQTLRRYSDSVGYSDHTESVVTGLAAAALGAELLEKHFTLDNHGPDVPDHKMALEPAALAEYVRWAEVGAALRGSGDLCVSPEERDARHGARRGVYARRPIGPLQEVVLEDLAFLRPANGISPADYPHLVGAICTQDLEPGDDVRL